MIVNLEGSPKGGVTGFAQVARASLGGEKEKLVLNRPYLYQRGMESRDYDSGGSSTDWCDIIVNATEDNVTTPFCVKVETYTGRIDPVRVVDVIVCLLNVLFLSFLAFKFVPTIRKLRGAWPLFSIVYLQVLIIPILCCLHEVLSMVFDHKAESAKISHYLLRGSILTTEISVVVFGLTFKFYHGQRFKLVLTMGTIVLSAIIYTVIEGTMDTVFKRHIVCDKHNLFTHGGMIFLFVTSALLSLAYMITFLLYLCNFHKRWNLPSKKSFYRYALFLSLVNVAQAVGSMLWFNGLNHRELANTGICLTMITTDIYLITFSPMVYWIFLSNYFRMNTSTNTSASTEAGDDVRQHRSPSKMGWKFSLKSGSSTSIPIYKQILQDESTRMLQGGESVGSEIGSYMSINNDYALNDS